MKKIMYALLCLGCFSSPQIVHAQKNEWQSAQSFQSNKSQNIIISTVDELKDIQKNWEIIAIRSQNQYIVAPKKNINYQQLQFDWKEYNPSKYVQENFSFHENKSTIYPAIIVFSPYINQSKISEIFSELKIPTSDLHSKFKGINVVTSNLTEEQITSLSKHKYVTSIELIYDDVTLNSSAQSLTQAHITKSSPLVGGQGLSGKGVVVGIGDDGDNTHIDISHRIIKQFSPILSGGHAIHVAVTATGNGIVNESAEGFASQSDVLSNYFNAVLAYGQELYEDYGMTLTNNSYAQRIGDCNFAGVYNATSQTVDMMMNANPYLFHIFAAGNDGLKTCAPYPTGFGTVVGFYQASKNALVVGNIGKNLQFLYNGSSKGPARDGRIKPEIGANGVAVFSGWTDNSYVNNNGTSMACPNVTGAAAIITEKYKALNDDQIPHSALLKILLMNGAQDVYNLGPDYFYGYGIMNVKQSLDMLINNQYIKDSITHAENKTYNIIIPNNVSKVKFMVYWNDVPAVPTPDDPSLPKLINDIDMTISSPTGEWTQPWILNPSSPTSPATRGTDRINNAEQITIENPSSGTYTLSLNGYNITTPNQLFYIAWDYEYNDLQLASPIGGEYFAETDSLRIYYSNPSTTNTFKIELSTNNGTSWTTIASAVESHIRHFNHLIPSSINSDQCLVKVSENGTSKVAISQPFTISEKPILELNVDNLQCPGSISVFWNNIPNSTGYILYIHDNGIMESVDTVSSTTLSYNFSGLRTDRDYQVSVAPIFNTQRGIRANAVTRIPNNGNCVDINNPDYDLALIDFNNLQNGRELTSQSLGGEQIISLRIQNRGKNTLNTFPLSLYLNDELVATQTFTGTLLPGQIGTFSFEDHPLNLISPATYSLKIHKNASSYDDGIKENDTIVHNVKQINNAPLDLTEGYIENFNLTPRGYYNHTHIGLDGAEKWDFIKNQGWGRLTHFINSSVSMTDSHALSMDIRGNARFNPDSISTNEAIITLNLSEYNIEEKEIRCDFLYRFAGKPKFFLENAIYLRGQDTDPWIFISHLDSTLTGTVKKSPETSLNDWLTAHGQNFSTSTQLKIQQKDSSLIAGVDFGNGLTIDSFRVYAITDDLSLENISQPPTVICESLIDNVTIEVRNNVFYTLYNVPVYYQIDDAPIQSGIIDSIPSKTTVNYTFETTENFSEYGASVVIAWVDYESDETRHNDTIRNSIIVTPQINDYPYLQSFDSTTTNHHFYTHNNSVWNSITPDKGIIQHAANGTKSFATSGISEDTVARISYLYSPCFDISELTQPTLSFSNAFNYNNQDVDNPTKAYIEYSEDGKTWKTLGAKEDGSNWYDNDNESWSKRSFNWISSSIELPKINKLTLRFVFESYSGNINDSWMIDDIHIYDKKYNIITDQQSISIIHSTTLDSFINDNQILGFLKANSTLGQVKLTINNHDEPIITDAHESLIMANFGIQHNHNGSYTLGLYVPHEALEKLWEESNCQTCYKVNSIYSTGLSKYSTEFNDEINGMLSDNISGQYTYIPREDILKIPYDAGYIVIFTHEKSGEIWFNSGMPYNNDISFIPIQLQGEQLLHHYAKVHFSSKIDEFTHKYFLENKDLLTGGFNTIAEYTPTDDTLSYYEYIDQPKIVDKQATYRLRYSLKDGSTRLTNEVTLFWAKNGSFAIYPNPTTDGTLNISWNLDQLADVEFHIVNVKGQTLLIKKVEPNEAQLGFITIDLKEKNLPPGHYFLHIRAGNESGVYKFVYSQ